ncbi:hypothetical protein BKA66DRAFT_579435 [Pyrenochaeta sp. MPI-SDFR-AT-0127]|nr:hypothetical protein BKA66DRAFT_579435 [Pyrenochaeta sp. MPI-SDFR-AT-0127]
MDPISGVALILGLPSLVVSCADFYRKVLISRRIGRDGALLLTKAAIEQAKFHDWLTQAGFLDGSPHKLHLNLTASRVVMSAIEGIKLTLENLGSIIDKYELDEGGEVTGLNFALPDRFWLQATGKQLPTDGIVKTEKRIRDGTRFSRKRFTWAAADMELSQNLINDLRRFNEDLRYASHEMGTSAPNLPSKVLPQVLNTEELERLVAAASETYPELSKCASMKLEALNIARDLSAPPQLQNELIRRRKLILTSSTSFQTFRNLVQYLDEGSQMTVLLEDKYYPKERDQAYDQFVHRRVYEVAKLLASTPKPSKFRALDCLGYVHDRIRGCYSFIFRLPPNFDESKSPVSLNVFWSESSERSISKVALGQRFDIARAVATSLLYLHACGILHKAFHSGNILFFQRKSEKMPDLSSPFLLGYDYARPHGVPFKSEVNDPLQIQGEQIYAHPDYDPSAKRRYLKAFDLYGLGVLLLEIAIWRSATTLIPPNTARSEARLLLINETLNLEPVVGAQYVGVVARCLTGDIYSEQTPTKAVSLMIDEEDELDGQNQNAFVRNIVERLDRCFA